jgi:hypothetical protein
MNYMYKVYKNSNDLAVTTRAWGLGCELVFGFYSVMNCNPLRI